MNAEKNLNISSCCHRRIPTLPLNAPVIVTKKLPSPSQVTRIKTIPFTDFRLLPARSHPDLLIDRRLFKSPQRHRKYLQSLGSSRILIAPCLLYLLFSRLLTADGVVISNRITNFSHPLNAPYEGSADLNTSFRSLLDEFPGIEMSDDLDLSVNDAEGVQAEDFYKPDDQEDYIKFDSVDCQKETVVVQGYSQTVKYEVLISDLVSAGNAQIYSDLRHVDFQTMLYAPKSDSLYAVAKGATLVKLDGKSLELSDVYSVPPLLQGSPYCQKARGCNQRTEINMLSRTPQKSFIFYCVLHYEEHSRGIIRQTLTSCVVPNPSNLAENVLMWGNLYYTSIDPHRPPVILIPQDSGPEDSVIDTPHQPFLYVAGVTEKYLRIGRLQMPNLATGKVHWDGALFSPKSSIFINEPATVVMSFETDSAIYFLLRERVSRSSRQSLQIVSRLIRLCRGDRGGLRASSERYFGTLAKADVICQSELTTKSTNGERALFFFDFAQSAHWDSDAKRLYIVFSAGEAAPHGSAVCVYDLFSIEKSFRGPISNSNNILRSSSNTFDDSARPNPFPNICDRFAAGNLSAEEIALGQIGANYLYRFEPIKPLFGHAIAMSPSSLWSAVIGYQLPQISSVPYSTSVMWMMSETHLIQFVFYETIRRVESLDSSILLKACELRRLRIGRNDSIMERLREGPNPNNESMEQKGFPRGISSPGDPMNLPEKELTRSILREGESIYLGTTHSIFRFPTDACASYVEEESCLASGDPHCGWNSQIFRCVSLLSSYGVKYLGFNFVVDAKTLPKCKPLNQPSISTSDTGWSPWHPCSMTNGPYSKAIQTPSGFQRMCLCRICLSDVFCEFGAQQVSQCKVPGVWSPWSNWSNCEDKLHFRTRVCLNPLLGSSISSSECVGSNREEEFCLMHPFIPEEVGFEAMRVEHVSLRESSAHGITIDRNHLIGLLVGIMAGVLCTLLLVFCFVRFCQPIRPRSRSRTNHPVRLRFHDESRSISNMELESQIRHSLLRDHPMYANPSPIDRSIQSASSPRYNFLLHQSPLMSGDRVSNFTLPSVEEPSTTTGFYDRLSENTGK